MVVMVESAISEQQNLKVTYTIRQISLSNLAIKTIPKTSISGREVEK
jgi:hypothetical protein